MSYYTHFSDSQLLQLHQHVKELVAHEKGTLPPEYNKQGRLRKRSSLPWMLPIWEKSLTLLNEEVQTRKIIPA